MNNPSPKQAVSPAENEHELCMQRMLAARYLVHTPVNFSDILDATLAGSHPPCPIFFAEHEALACVHDAHLRRIALEKVAARFPEPPLALQYLIRQYESRGNPAQKADFLLLLIESVRKRTNIRAQAKMSAVRSSYEELELLCEGKSPRCFLGHIDCSARSDRRGHRVSSNR